MQLTDSSGLRVYLPTFFSQRHEIFTLGVIGILKMTQPYLMTSEDFRGKRLEHFQVSIDVPLAIIDK